MELFLMILVLFMAFYNGANDVSKGVATLCGSGLCGYRTALLWGTVWTVAGGITAFFLASALYKVFSNGIVSSDLNLTVNFSMAVAIGVSTWVSPGHLEDFDSDRLNRRRIVTGLHCYGCTAGAGSSCTGTVA